MPSRRMSGRVGFLAIWGAIFTLTLAVAAGPSRADIAGRDDDGFRVAVAQWLDGDEAAALTALSQKAQAGNTAARILLALIDKTPALQGPWLTHLGRADRLALLRAPGGMSGRSWMHAASEDSPLAELWLQLWDVRASMELPVAFAAAGEPRAAREALVALAVRERRGFAGLADWEGYPSSLRHLVWREWKGDPDRAEDRTAEIAALDPGDPQRQRVGLPLSEAALAEWLLTAPEAAAVAAFCTARCPGTVESCVLAAEDGLGSHRVLMVFGSPSERLIPAEVFHASPRGQAALLRRILLNADARGRRTQFARAEARDACFAGHLEAEAQRYMIKRD